MYSTGAMMPDQRIPGRKYRPVGRNLRRGAIPTATSQTFEAEGVPNGNLKTELIVLTVIFGIIIADMNF